MTSEARNGDSRHCLVGPYANSAFGTMTPQDGDIVEWISNNERWTVKREDDLEGPSALHLWPDGGWCNVRLIDRPNAEHQARCQAAPECSCSQGGAT